MSIKTIQKWIDNGEFPAYRTPGGRWFTTKHLVNLWIVFGYEEELKQRAMEIGAEEARAMAFEMLTRKGAGQDLAYTRKEEEEGDGAEEGA